MIDLHRDYGLHQKYESIQKDFGYPRNQIFMVRNRKEEENMAKVPLVEVQRKEDEFFQKGAYDLKCKKTSFN